MNSPALLMNIVSSIWVLLFCHETCTSVFYPEATADTAQSSYYFALILSIWPFEASQQKRNGRDTLFTAYVEDAEYS